MTDPWFNLSIGEAALLVVFIVFYWRAMRGWDRTIKSWEADRLAHGIKDDEVSLLG